MTARSGVPGPANECPGELFLLRVSNIWATVREHTFENTLFLKRIAVFMDLVRGCESQAGCSG
jgi:hypothetical protein